MPRGRRKSSLAQPLAVDDEEDELASSAELKRATPLHSTEQGTLSRSAGTPYANLRQLAGLIKRPSTPAGRATSDDNTRTTRLSALRQSSLKRPARPVPFKKGAPTTPHAIRALQERKNARSTPGQDRRRSGRQQRETPRDILRNLSRALVAQDHARGVKSSRSSLRRSSSLRPNYQDDSESDELNDDIPKPRLSLPIDDGDEDFQVPPRLSLPLDAKDDTQTSIEAPRRAFPNEDLTRMSRTSMRMSDRFGDLSGLEDGDLDINVPGQEQQVEFDVPPAPRFLEPSTGSDMDDSRTNFSPHDQPDPAQDDSFDFNVPILQSPDLGAIDEPTFDQPSSDDDESMEAPDEVQMEEALEVPDDVPMDDDRSVQLDEQQTFQAAEGAADRDQPRLAIRGRKAKELKKSRHGIPYPPLPSTMIKKIVKATSASGGSKLKVDKDILAALTQASDWFFEQLGEDLGAYAEHARRKTIEESDVVTLMKRQRLVTANITPFSLAQRKLPSELLQAVRMMPPGPPPKPRRKRLETIGEEDSGDAG